MLIARFMVVLFLLLSSACATRHALRVGDTRVIIEKTQHGVGKNFIHVHQNETTALRAAKAVVAQEGGSVMTLVHSGGRNIVFHLDKKRYEFDPNRIYTDEGIKKHLPNSEPIHDERMPKFRRLLTLLSPCYQKEK